MADNFKEPGAINLQEENNQIDLSKILPAEKNRTSNETWDQLNWQTTIFAFNLLNDVRTQLGLEPLTLNKTAMQMAAEVAQNYYNDGKSDFNNRHHDAEAVNKAAEKRNLQYVQNYGTDDPHSSNDQYYEALAGGFAKGEIKVILPKENGDGYGITFGLPASNDNSYESNLDSIKQAIFGNLAEMLLVDGSSGWSHTIQLLNIGGYQDYGQKHPIYRFGASMHLLPRELDEVNGAKYSNHYIVIPPHFMQPGAADPFKDTDEKGPQNTFNSAALTKQQQKYLDEANELANLKEEKASIEQQIRQQSLARDNASDLVNKLQTDLKQAQNEKDGLNGQQTNAQNKSKEADEKLAEHEQAIKDAQNKLEAAQKAAQEAEAKKEETERKADAGKIKADESDQEVKNQTSQSEQKQQETKDAALVYQKAQNAGTSSSSDNNSSKDDSAKADNGSKTNSSVKADESDSSADDDANEDEPDDNDDDSGDEADEDNSDSSVSNNGVQGESSIATHHGNVYSGLVHSMKDQNTQTASDTASGFNEQSSTLPQTGESENGSAIAALAGAAAVSISLIGLAGVRKRKRI